MSSQKSKKYNFIILLFSVSLSLYLCEGYLYYLKYKDSLEYRVKVYKKETGKKLATRTRFKDSVDFIGWYTNKSQSLLKISQKDAFKQYIAYHEGWGNYKNYKNNKKVINLAKKVEAQSNVYKKQLNKCVSKLNKNKYVIF